MLKQNDWLKIAYISVAYIYKAICMQYADFMLVVKLTINCVITFSSTVCGFEACSNRACNCIKGFENCIRDKTCSCIACCDIYSK